MNREMAGTISSLSEEARRTTPGLPPAGQGGQTRVAGFWGKLANGGRGRIQCGGLSSEDPKSGDKLDDRYLLGREIGRGGHGVVFAAEDLTTNERVAVKILHQNIADDPQYA